MYIDIFILLIFLNICLFIFHKDYKLSTYYNIIKCFEVSKYFFYNVDKTDDNNLSHRLHNIRYGTHDIRKSLLSADEVWRTAKVLP